MLACPEVCWLGQGLAPALTLTSTLNLTATLTLTLTRCEEAARLVEARCLERFGRAPAIQVRVRVRVRVTLTLTLP